MNGNESRPWLDSYDPGVAPEMAVPEESYLDLLEKTLGQYPDTAVYHFLGSSCTYRDLDDRSLRFASYLLHIGCQPGDVVAINLPNTPQYLVALAGIMRAGCVANGVSPLLTANEMAYQMGDAGVKVLVTLDAIFETRVQKICDKVPALRGCVVTNIADCLPFYKRYAGKWLKKIPTGKVAPLAGKEVITYRALMRQYAPQRPDVRVAVDDTCLIQYTGGTTGLPKGAILSHRNLVSNIVQAQHWLNFGEERIVGCSGFPFFHQAGLYFGMLNMGLGYTQCIIPDPRNTAHLCKEIAQHRPRVMLHVPSLYQMLMDDPGFARLDFSDCEMCISGAAPFTKEGIAALEKIVGAGKLVEIWGMTECSPLITMNPLKGTKKIGSQGLPVQNTRVKLVDVETGTVEVPLGETGEAIVRGPQVMQGYHNKPEDNAQTLREFNGEQWLYTGDVARMDEDGYIYLTDRTKDMLIVGGFKVFSREVEEVLSQQAAVQLCAVIGLPNPKRPDSQIVKAVVQLAETSRESDRETIKKMLSTHCQENLAAYKVPKVIEIVDAMPLTAVGKVDKKALRQISAGRPI